MLSELVVLVVLVARVGAQTLPDGVTVGDNCVFASNDYTDIIIDGQARIEYMNIANLRQHPQYRDFPFVQCGAQSASNPLQYEKCRYDTTTNTYWHTWAVDWTTQYQSYQSTATIGADVYNTDIPSGMLISNAVRLPDGSRHDLHIDIDYDYLPAGMASYYYYQPYNWYQNVLKDGFVQINQASPRWTNTRGSGAWIYAWQVGGTGTAMEGLAPGDFYTVRFKMQAYESGTTNTITLGATRISFFDLDTGVTFPGCDNDPSFDYHATSIPSTCSVCGTGQSLPYTGNANILDCQTWFDGRNKRDPGIWAQECLGIDVGGSAGANGVTYKTEVGSTTPASGVPVGEALEVSMTGANTMSVCGILPHFGSADNPTGPMNLVEPITITKDGWHNQLGSMGSITFPDFSQKAKTVQFVYESVDVIKFTMSTAYLGGDSFGDDPQTPDFVSGRNFQIAGPTNLLASDCPPNPPRTPPPSPP